MDTIKQWVFCLVVSAACSTLLNLISPRGSAEKTLKTVVGIFVITAICAPLTELKSVGSEFADMITYEELETCNVNDAQMYIQTVKSMIESEIESSAKGIGIEFFKTESDVSYDDDGCIIIQKVAVFTDEQNQEKLDDFSVDIRKRLGGEVTVIREKDGTQIEAG